jgi:hypothetical protein
MNALWDAYWPVALAAVVIGLNAGAFALRKRGASRFHTRAFARKRALALAVGVAVTLTFGAVWHGPVGWGERFASGIENRSRKTLTDFEMTQVHAQLERGPLRRTLVLSGSADDFQRSELVRIMGAVPGVGEARWQDMPEPLRLPLLAEVELAALVSFGLGLFMAYLLELRRRSRAQWRW